MDWLDQGAPPTRTPSEVLLHLSRRLVELGLPLYRVAVFVRTLHPNVLGRAFIWHRDQAQIEVTSVPHSWQQSEQFLQSPVRVVFQQHVEIRRRLSEPGCPMDFPVLEDFRREGMTDFVALPLNFINGDVHAASFATQRAGGFTEAELQTLRRLMPPFSRVAEIYALMRVAHNILDAYLGQQAGEKVLSGHIRRGDGEEIHAVIWFCDLRDSTPLAESMSRDAFLRLLNEFFECVLEPVLERKGEVLRFIGDAALAIFPVSNDPREACGRALDAARAAISRMDRLNQGRKVPLRFGIGLHLGDVLYGNIGTPSRIEFTVIGAAANEAARIEGLCKALDAPLLLSERVVQYLQGDFVSLGRHALRGVGEPVEIFALRR